ncbi:hypothetical protein [Streptomyces violaceusniger]|uniref:hypothetical protein n=1 Tax=Streptomyces violaceusniger TaxID=68280 RepID=UPI003F56D29C
MAHHRRLVPDYEALPTRSTAMIYIAMIALRTTGAIDLTGPVVLTVQGTVRLARPAG